ncbi:hypothetical protein FS837_011476 [Tulasnella sp. UAMH 9824]|nr:hypothetical protein FS837_011476 [Tulasnella sp. UAMH 9824]
MALVAYRVGAEWLRLSRHENETSASETPSPAQYGLLVRLLGTSSLRSVAEGIVYTAQSRNRTRLPRMLRYSILLAVAVWVLARLVGLTDVWLHGTSYSVRSNVTEWTEPSPSDSTMWGVAFNDSICEDMRRKYPNTAAEASSDWPCQIPFESFINYEDWGHARAFDTLIGSTNASFLVGMVEGDTAFAFPGPNFSQMEIKNFVIPTFATRASCDSVNDRCRNSVGIPDCSSANYPGLPYFPNGNSSSDSLPNRILGLVEDDENWIVGRTLGSNESFGLPRNPANMFFQLRWEKLEQGLASGVDTDNGAEDGLAIDQGSQPTLYAGCNLTFFDAFVEWNSTMQNWSLLNKTDPDPERMAALWLPLVWQYATEQLAANLMYTARKDPKEVVMRTLGQDLAKLTLASAAGFYKPGNAYDVTVTEKIMVSVYPAEPILVLLLLLCAYALLASAIFISAYQAPDEMILVPVDDHGQGEEMETSTLTLAQRWLTNPLPLVGYSFSREDGQDGMRSAAYSPMNAAYDGDERHTRLTIGLDGDRFGVSPWGQK